MLEPTTTAPVSPTKTKSAEPVVSSVVDEIVNEAVEKATVVSSLNAEKRHVQSLINKLVSRVQTEASTAAKATPTTPTPEPPRTESVGVPLGDHRPRALPNYPLIWTQTLDSVTLSIPVPSWVSKRQVSVAFVSGAISVRVMRSHSQEPLIHISEPLLQPIDPDGCMWSLEGSLSRVLTLELEKLRNRWWPKLFMADDPALYTIAHPSASKLAANSTSVPPAISPPENPPQAASDPQSPTSVQTGAESGDSVESAVSEMVDEIVDIAASRKKNGTSEVAQRAAGVEGRRTQRVITKADLPKLIEKYRENVDRDDQTSPEAALQLATFYHHGVGVEKDDKEAARLYRYALERGAIDPSAAFQLGLIYNQGAPGLESDPKEAVRWWRLSATLGNSVAMFNLGVMYMNGSGCDMDPIVATKWFQQAQALNPQLQPPQFTRAQLEQRITQALKLKKERMKRSLPPEERQRRKEQALKNVRTIAYGTTALAGIAISMFAVRYWLRNRL